MFNKAHDDLTRENVEKLWLHRPQISITAIGKKLGMTKGAVVGLAHRMGLPPRPSPIKRDREPGAPSAGRVRAGRPARKSPKSISDPADYADGAGGRVVPSLEEVLRDSSTLAALARGA